MGDKPKETPMRKLISKFVRQEEGLETVEYAVVAALLVLAAVTAITALGTYVKDTFQAVGVGQYGR
jgi:pilus assembly protein Flp/PilA